MFSGGSHENEMLAKSWDGLLGDWLKNERKTAREEFRMADGVGQGAANDGAQLYLGVVLLREKHRVGRGAMVLSRTRRKWAYPLQRFIVV